MLTADEIPLATPRSRLFAITASPLTCESDLAPQNAELNLYRERGRVDPGKRKLSCGREVMLARLGKET